MPFNKENKEYNDQRKFRGVGGGDGDDTAIATIIVDPETGEKIDFASSEKQQELLDELSRLIPYLRLRDPSLEPTFARDSADRLRVSVDTGTVSLATIPFWANGNYSNMYASGGFASVDGREQLTEINNLMFYQQTVSRWKFT